MNIFKVANKFRAKLIKAGWKDELHGGKADKKKPSDFDPKQLEIGKKIEMEHTDDPHIATEIEMDHLEEFPKYYTGLTHMEELLSELSGKKEESEEEEEEEKD